MCLTKLPLTRASCGRHIRSLAPLRSCSRLVQPRTVMPSRCSCPKPQEQLRRTQRPLLPLPRPEKGAWLCLGTMLVLTQLLTSTAVVCCRRERELAELARRSAREAEEKRREEERAKRNAADAQQLDEIKQVYLGAPKEKKKVVKPADKFKFLFDWEPVRACACQPPWEALLSIVVSLQALRV